MGDLGWVHRENFFETVFVRKKGKKVLTKNKARKAKKAPKKTKPHISVKEKIYVNDATQSKENKKEIFSTKQC